MKNRIIFVPQYFYPTYGGLQHFTNRLSNSFLKEGIRVRIISPEPELGRKVHRELLRSVNAKIEYLPGTRERFWNNLLPCIKEKRKNYKHIFFIGLEYENLINAQLSCIKYAKLLNYKVYLRIATTGDFEDVINNDERIKQITTCDKIIVPTEFMKSKIVLDDKIESRVDVIYNIYDDSKYRCYPIKERNSFRKYFNLPIDKSIAIWSGRITEIKNLHDLLLAWKIANIDSLLILVGNSDVYEDQIYQNEIRKLIQDKKIHNVIFLGFLNESDMYKIYNSSDFYITTSVREGLCNSAIEAVLCGLPIVGYDISGIREVAALTTSQFNIFSEIYNIEVLSKNILSIFKNLQEIRKLRCKIKIRISKNQILNYFLKTFFEE
ncbi:glycosyltransferase family 4 protein [bacterium]|nr:glycosyltransferase family 4 protein [bacterium]